MRPEIAQWVWIGISAALVFWLVYVISRGGQPEGRVAPSPQGQPPEPAVAKDEAAKVDAAKVAAPKVELEAIPIEVSISPSAAPPELPRIHHDEDEDVDPTRVGARAAGKQTVLAPTHKIVFDEDAVAEEPTRSGVLILVTASAQTDKGLRRKRNEDSLLVLAEHALYVVADGMGGYAGGEIASALAVKTIARAFETNTFPGLEHDNIPKRASQLARAVQAANSAVLDHASTDKKLEGMGTTVCAAYFSPNKQRLYVGHVGDSRLYRLRKGTLRQMTSDHTMKQLGLQGPGSDHLSRALGIWPLVPIDVLLEKPRPGDLYLLCSDGLTKMVPDSQIGEILGAGTPMKSIVDQLIATANANGGKDNISVIAIRVDDPTQPKRP